MHWILISSLMALVAWVAWAVAAPPDATDAQAIQQGEWRRLDTQGPWGGGYRQVERGNGEPDYEYHLSYKAKDGSPVPSKHTKSIPLDDESWSAASKNAERVDQLASDRSANPTAVTARYPAESFAPYRGGYSEPLDPNRPEEGNIPRATGMPGPPIKPTTPHRPADWPGGSGTSATAASTPRGPLFATPAAVTPTAGTSTTRPIGNAGPSLSGRLPEVTQVSATSATSSTAPAGSYPVTATPGSPIFQAPPVKAETLPLSNPPPLSNAFPPMLDAREERASTTVTLPAQPITAQRIPTQPVDTQPVVPRPMEDQPRAMLPSYVIPAAATPNTPQQGAGQFDSAPRNITQPNSTPPNSAQPITTQPFVPQDDPWLSQNESPAREEPAAPRPAPPRATPTPTPPPVANPNSPPARPFSPPSAPPFTPAVAPPSTPTTSVPTPLPREAERVASLPPRPVVDERQPLPTQPAPPPAAAPVKSFDEGRLIAVVGGEPILAADAYCVINEQLALRNIPPDQWEIGRERSLPIVLRSLIENKVIFADARKNIPAANFPRAEENAGKDFDKKTLKKKLAEEGVTTAAELDAKLKTRGTSLERIRRQAVERTIAGMWLSEQIDRKEEVPHAKIAEYYQKHASEFQNEARVRWEELAIFTSRAGGKAEAWAQITALGNQVLQGGDFAEIARKSSHGATAKNGGAYDWTTAGSLVSKEIDQAVFTLPVGRMSQVIESDRGFHIVRVIDRKQAGLTPFTEAQVDIRKKLKEESWIRQRKAYLDKIRAATPVWTIYDDQGGLKTALDDE